jgi:hypothetical protein
MILLRLHLRNSELIALSALLSAILLQGCVTSQFPLLESKTAVADRSLIGSYITLMPHADKPSISTVYLRGTQYLLSQDGKLGMIVTLHNSSAGVYLAQGRWTKVHDESGKAIPSRYTYFLVRKTATGAELNTLPCSSDCRPTNMTELSNLIALATQDFHGKELLTATKIESR